MADQRKTRAQQADEALPPVAESDSAAPADPQTPPPVAADANAARAASVPLDEDDNSAGRVKVTRSDLLRNSMQWLGVERHVMVGVLAEDDRDEMTLNAARKAVETWRAKQQTTTTVEED